MWARASSAYRSVCWSTPCTSWPSAAAFSAPAAASRHTVRMVPSTGFSSADSSRWKPRRIAPASSRARMRKRAPIPSSNPTRKWESIIPELPREPITAAWATARETSGRGASPSRCSASVMDFMVRAKLVPVSPSGTGKTLMRFSSSRPARTHVAAARSDRRSRGPSR